MEELPLQIQNSSKASLLRSMKMAIATSEGRPKKRNTLNTMDFLRDGRVHNADLEIPMGCHRKPRLYARTFLRTQKVLGLASLFQTV